MILIDGKTHTLTDALAWLRATHGVTGPVLSSERR